MIEICFYISQLRAWGKGSEGLKLHEFTFQGPLQTMLLPTKQDKQHNDR
jgi:hypothetical protein